jgi:FKBP-type peptidyl-prolyl cis-trans isomerase (trigger factor)
MGLEARGETKPEDKIVAGPFYQVKEMTADKLVVIFTYVLYPEIEITNYKGLDIKYIESKVTAEDVNLELKKIQERLSI